MATRYSITLKYAAMLTATALICGGMFFGYFTYRTYNSPFIRSEVKTVGDPLIQQDDTIGFVSRPESKSKRNHVLSRIHYDIFTDRIGARVDAPGDETPENVAIMFIGGSFTWGHGVENTDTFASIIGRRLNVPVANLGLASYGTVQSLQIMERNMGLKPKIIIYGFITDHMRRNLSPCAPSYVPYCLPVSYIDFADGNPNIHPPDTGAFSFDDNEKYYREVLMGGKGVSLDDILWRMRIDIFRFAESKDISYTNDYKTRSESMSLLMNKMSSEAEAAGAKLVIVYMPDMGRYQRRYPPPPELVKSAGETDTLLLNLAPYVERHYKGGGSNLVFENDPHPNVMGHRLIADVIIDELVKRNVIIVGRQ